MTKQKKILAIVGLILVVVGIGLVLLTKVSSKPKITLQTDTATPTPIEKKLLTYNDEAGFSFQYPEGITVKDVSGDQDVYSILEITKGAEKMAIKVVDTKYTIDSWLKTAPEASGAGVAREVDLAGMNGQQIQFDNPKKLVSIVIKDKIMYYFESPLDTGGEWNKIHNQIVGSFTLGESETKTNGNQATTTSDDIIYEEEEIIE